MEAIFFGKPPHHHTRSDFEVLGCGWQSEGRGAQAFEAAVLEQRKEWNDARHHGVQQRQAEERKHEAKGLELVEWLEELGLAQYGPELRREGVDLETLQFL